MPRIEIEQMQHIQLRMPDLAHDYPAQILDKNPSTLVIRVPDGLLRLESPTEVTLVVGQRGYQYDATTSVLAVYEDWWFVRRPGPDDFRSSQRREFVRIVFKDEMIAIPTDIRGQPKGSPLTLSLRDLSAHGCYGFVEQQLQQGDRLMLIFSLPGLPILSTISQIMRVTRRTEKGAWYGFRFESLAPEQVELLVKFITARIQTNLREGIDITLH